MTMATKYPIEVPSKLYKFMNSRFVDSFMEGKSIKIGTLEDFRRVELHQLNKGDPMEGKLHVMSHGPGYPLDDPKNAALKTHLRSLGASMEGCYFDGAATAALVELRHPDCYVFCASLEFDEQIAADLDIEYDTCVEIGNPDFFITSLTHSIMPHCAGTFDAKRVIYSDRKISPSSQAFENTPFHKEKRFWRQKEYRMAYTPKTRRPAPFLLSLDMSLAQAKVCWKR